MSTQPNAITRQQQCWTRSAQKKQQQQQQRIHHRARWISPCFSHFIFVFHFFFCAAFFSWIAIVVSEFHTLQLKTHRDTDRNTYSRCRCPLPLLCFSCKICKKCTWTTLITGNESRKNERKNESIVKTKQRQIENLNVQWKENGKIYDEPTSECKAKMKRKQKLRLESMENKSVHCATLIFIRQR